MELGYSHIKSNKSFSDDELKRNVDIGEGQ
jgi:hypothetical protein